MAIIVPEMTNNLDNQAILRRVGQLEQQPICPNSILLNASKTTTFGRTVASNVRLLSCKVPLMISRKHASVTFQDEKWTIIDHNVSGLLLVVLDFRKFLFLVLNYKGKRLKFLQLGGKYL